MIILKGKIEPYIINKLILCISKINISSSIIISINYNITRRTFKNFISFKIFIYTTTVSTCFRCPCLENLEEDLEEDLEGEENNYFGYDIFLNNPFAN